jgi:hypothetical protein
MLRYSLVLAAGLWVAGGAGAATWADGLFDDLSKDFGSVPRGPTLTHHFRVTNNTGQAVNISGVRVSCGCTSATALQTYLNPGAQTAILVKMDTTRFIGPKAVTIYVQFDRPRFEEVRLWVQANGRNDFVLTPEAFSFGQVRRGSGPSTTVNVTFYGNSDAKILSIQGESLYIQPRFAEVRRGDSEVVYALTTQLRSDTPVGRWYTDVWVKTNLPTMPQVRVPVTVEIESPLTVTPSVLALGALRVDGESERRVIVRGVKPFRITAVTGGDADLQAKTSSNEAREVHVLTIRLHPHKAGNLDRTLHVKTDLGGANEIDFQVSAVVTP